MVWRGSIVFFAAFIFLKIGPSALGAPENEREKKPSILHEFLQAYPRAMCSPSEKLRRCHPQKEENCRALIKKGLKGCLAYRGQRRRWKNSRDFQWLGRCAMRQYRNQLKKGSSGSGILRTKECLDYFD